MTWEVLVAAMFLLAIPLNISVAQEVHRYAKEKPRIPILDLLSRISWSLTAGAIVTGFLAFGSVVLLTTSIRIVPQPVGTIGILFVLFLVSGLNLFVRAYLRSKRRSEL